ncbi:glycosyltransferase family 2 protein [Streptococcus sp. DD13]|uniref:glycosyltransferase family 2 protein n=1 Tax=Streptococcus sp. DD13 TaxID=1777881 RepID=UPI0007997BA4|nr:glycosyltransferase family 2 protein [Streptococcus sp. DD13]KXT79141.1 Alpha-L-Rha alpha-1,3-L-rhamnosyltransferase [Streptococcus sp. DD13]
MKVNILMSTYNGERFLVEQLDSIRNQTYTDWTLWIRDDGSTDGTRTIIQDYTQLDSRIHWMNPDDRQNLGVIGSFYALVKAEVADVYFFSDQDDVWLPEKIEKQVAVFAKADAQVPLMVYMDLKVVDQELTVVNESMIRSQSHHANTQLIQELTENSVTGGVAGINHALARLWNRTDRIIMHDWYLALLATSFGQLVYIDEPGELYRQHANNVLGARTLDKRFKLLREGPRKIFTRYWKLIHDSQDQARNILELKGASLSKDKRDLLEQFIDIDQQGFFERWKRIVRNGYRKNQWKHILVFRTLLLTNLYNERKK